MGTTYISPYTPTKEIFKKTNEFEVVSGQLKSGYVLKRNTFLQFDANGYLIPYVGVAKSSQVTFSALTAGQTLILAGLTWTAGGSGTTVAQLVAAFRDIASGTAAAALTARNIGGTFTGTLAAYNIEYGDADTVIFNADTLFTNATTVANTGTGSVTIVTNASSFPTTYTPPVGCLLYDVDSSSAAYEINYIKEASFWADALIWKNDPSDTLTVTNTDGTETVKTLSAYNTGAFGTSAAAKRFKQVLVSGSELEELGFTQLGDL